MKMSRWFLVGVLSLILMNGCGKATGPLATLPMVSPTASASNMAGVQAYNNGNWELAKKHFMVAVEADEKLPEAYYNLALTLHKLEDHSRATEYFKKAGELAPKNNSIIKSTLYRNHLGLSSTFERHISGGYRYAQ